MIAMGCAVGLGAWAWYRLVSYFIARRSPVLIVALFVLALFAFTCLRAASASAAQHPAAAAVANYYRSVGKVDSVTCGRRHGGETSCTAVVREYGQTAKYVKALLARYVVAVDWAPTPHVARETTTCLGLMVSKVYPAQISYLIRQKNGTLKPVFTAKLVPGKVYWSCFR